jgi:hypothetical protein
MRPTKQPEASTTGSDSKPVVKTHSAASRNVDSASTVADAQQCINSDTHNRDIKDVLLAGDCLKERDSEEIHRTQSAKAWLCSVENSVETDLNEFLIYCSYRSSGTFTEALEAAFMPLS